MQFVLRPNNGHAQHIITDNVTIPAEGRDCVVNSEQAAPFVLEGESPKEKEPDLRILSLSPAGYEHVRKLFGGALICEPKGGFDIERDFAAQQLKLANDAELARLRKVAETLDALHERLLTALGLEQGSLDEIVKAVTQLAARKK